MSEKQSITLPKKIVKLFSTLVSGRFIRSIFILFLCSLVGLGIYFRLDVRAWFGGGQSFFDMAERRLYYMFDMPLFGTPRLDKLDERLQAKGVALGDPIFMRIFKKESELELWVKKGQSFILFETYPICRWSGVVGPKQKQGDRQAPEGFYTVSKGQLNPNSRWFRSFNLGYPNAFDRSYKRTGDFLMVHGGCGSIGCYAMTNPVIAELWKFVTQALNRGQRRFHVHAFPFRMTELNMALHQRSEWHAFWQDLKKGYDQFEETKVPPVVRVCKKRYRIDRAALGSPGNSRVVRRCVRKASLTEVF